MAPEHNNVDPDAWYHFVSLGHTELSYSVYYSVLKNLSTILIPTCEHKYDT